MHLTDWTCSDCEGLVQRGRGWGLQDCEGFWALGSEVETWRLQRLSSLRHQSSSSPRPCRPRPRRRVVASSSPRRRLYLHMLCPSSPWHAVVAASRPHPIVLDGVATSSRRRRRVPFPSSPSSSQPHRRRRRQPVRRNRRAAPPVTPRRPNQHEHAWARTAA